MTPEEPPYPLPEHWTLQAPRQGSIRWLVGFAVVCVAGLGGTIALLARQEPVGAIMPAVVFLVIGLCLAVVTERTGDERGDPRFINAVTLTNAQRRPHDSWIHFFREAPPRRRLTAAFAVIGVLGTAVAVVGGVQAVTLGHVGALIAYVPMLLTSAVFAFVGGVGFVTRWRLASWARRATGLAVGAAGVSHYLLDDVRTWTWDEITEVAAAASVYDTATGDYLPYVRLTVAGESEPVELSVSDHEAHGWVIYAAARFWREHPDARSELSNTFAQQRMERWAAWIREAAQAGPASATA